MQKPRFPPTKQKDGLAGHPYGIRCERPYQDSNLGTWFRKPLLYPLSYRGKLSREYSTSGGARQIEAQIEAVGPRQPHCLIRKSLPDATAAIVKQPWACGPQISLGGHEVHRPASKQSASPPLIW